jgi:ketosteroid isomerase-like protein
MSNYQLLQTFYIALANRDVKTMLSCYHENVIYHDVGFGLQKGKDAKKVWLYLMRKGDENVVITFSNIVANETNGEANWIAKYTFNNRKIENHISVTFQFKDGKIIYHKDDYSLFKWSQQAFGLVGYLVGWSPIFHWFIRWQMRRLLLNYKL